MAADFMAGPDNTSNEGRKPCMVPVLAALAVILIAISVALHAGPCKGQCAHDKSCQFLCLKANYCPAIDK